MACVLVPAAEAVIVSLAVISLKVYAHHHEKKTLQIVSRAKFVL